MGISYTNKLIYKHTSFPMLQVKTATKLSLTCNAIFVLLHFIYIFWMGNNILLSLYTAIVILSYIIIQIFIASFSYVLFDKHLTALAKNPTDIKMAKYGTILCFILVTFIIFFISSFVVEDMPTYWLCCALTIIIIPVLKRHLLKEKPIRYN